MPTGKRIDWSKYDDFIRESYVSMTIDDIASYVGISSIVIIRRLRKLGIKLNNISHKPRKLKQYDNELVSRIVSLRDKHSIEEISKMCNISKSTIIRINKRHSIQLSDIGKTRAKNNCSIKQLGKVPWNKNGTLSDETKLKISIATSGKNNSQYGKGMTEEEKEKWRISYNRTGRNKMISWVKSEEGQCSVNKALITIRSSQFRSKASQRSTNLVMSGVLKTNRGIGSTIITVKGGTIRTKSTYETAYVNILENDQSVIKFEYESFRIKYVYSGYEKYYVPDFLITYVDGSQELIEVKPAKLVNLPINQAKILAGQNCGIKFRVVTEVDLFNED